jgi:hypothetical protein
VERLVGIDEEQFHVAGMAKWTISIRSSTP